MTPPRLLVTLGDIAGIGPEIVTAAWSQLQSLADVRIVGDPARLPPGLPVVNPSSVDLSLVPPGVVTAAAGQAAYDWLCYAIDECLAGRADGIVTCPLHKEGLHAAGIQHPGHTEILAERTGTSSFAMLLYDDALRLAVAHVTLHLAMRDALPRITQAGIEEKIQLLHALVPQLTGTPATIAVAALNPHAGDGGLFGDEEVHIIQPAIANARFRGMDVVGPIAADAIFLRREQFQGIVALYHDQGHIPMKLLGGRRAVNISAGLPIIRTSVAHGTAYDIVGRGLADPSSLVSAVRVAARLASVRKSGTILHS
jgi:4-hydroxythreonine-4-phosphate dehydrogenase